MHVADLLLCVNDLCPYVSGANLIPSLFSSITTFSDLRGMLISLPPSVSPLTPSGSSISELCVNTSICMDPDRPGRGGHRSTRYLAADQMLQYPDHVGSSRGGNIPQHHSSPLPQREWTYSSSPVQPYDRLPTRTLHRSTSARPTYVAWTPVVDQSPQQSTQQRRRRGRGGSRDSIWWVDQDTEYEDATVYDGSHHLRTSPYNNRLSTYSAPEELEHHDRRTMTAEGSIGYSLISSPDTPMSFSRSPTYPPACGRRYYGNPRIFDDASFADEEEFHLFLQATAGLQEEDIVIYPHLDPTPASPLARQRVSPPQRPSQHEISTDLISPIDEASMTMCALRHLAQMPEGLPDPLPNLSIQSQPPQAPPSVATISPEESQNFDDELPGYEESQAEAWSHQRVEAARRAQELQTRWQQTGARRGPLCNSDLYDVTQSC